MHADQWFEIVGKAIILIATAIQFFWVLPLQNVEQSLNSIMVRKELIVLNGRMSAINLKINRLKIGRVSQSDALANASSIFDEMVQSMERAQKTIDSPEFSAALNGAKTHAEAQLSRLNLTYFYSFLFGSVLILLGGFMGNRRENTSAD